MERFLFLKTLKSQNVKILPKVIFPHVAAHIFYLGDAWEGELCSAKTCPGDDGPCSGNGVCNAIASECTCDPGWQGDRCELPQCLKDCSGMV